MSETSRALAVPNHPGVFQKGNRYQVRYRHHGKQKARSFRTLSEADRFKGKIDSGDTQPTSRESFHAYALRWIDSYTGRTARGLSDSTRESYRDALNRHAIPFFGTCPLDRIDPPMLRKYIAKLAASPAPRGQTLSAASVRRFYAPVRALLATAFEDGLLRVNPAAGVRVIVSDKRAKKPRWLTTDQTKDLLAQIPAKHADLAYFLAATGCRISEALRARWQDVAPDDRGRIMFSVTEAKTEAGIRTILLSPETARRLTLRRSQARYAAGSDPIFPTSTGSPIDPRNWRTQVFRPAANRADVPWATPHKLRHGLASLMANKGHSAAQIAAHLGHADGGVLALRTYIHSDQIDSADFIDSALS